MENEWYVQTILFVDLIHPEKKKKKLVLKQQTITVSTVSA